MPKVYVEGGNRPAGAAMALARGLLVLLSVFCLGALDAPLSAGELFQEAVADFIDEPVFVGERDKELPVWPLFRSPTASPSDLVGYAFESIDLAPIAGYAGSPPNILVAITPEGKFIGVSIVSHNEPIFKHGVEEDKLRVFEDQYVKRKLSLTQVIKVMPTNAAAPQPTGGTGTEWIDGVARATVSVRIINTAILSAAMKIARAKLGIGGGRDPDAAAKLKPDSGVTLTPGQVVQRSYLARTTIDMETVQKRFGKRFDHDVEPSPGTDPDAQSTDVFTLYLSAPEIGRAVLGKDGFARLVEQTEEGDHVILLGSSGRYGFRGGDQLRGSVPENLILSQDKFPIAINDAIDLQVLQSADLPDVSNWFAVKIHKEAGFDPTHPFELSMRVTRRNTELFPRRETSEFPIAFNAPREFFAEREVPLEGWRAIWSEQRAQIGLAAAAVLLLSGGLFMQGQLTANARRFDLFRMVFLTVTLVGIGWWGQGQLSINNVLAVINAARTNGGFGFLLFDPVSLLLWVFVLATLVIFGRGTFCGWLCPFGAFQEFVGNIAQRLKVPQYSIPYALDRKLRILKYVLLGAIVVSALTYTPAAEWLAELEPFKTAITLGFDRTWPFVTYAVAVLALGAFVYKGFCLYLCPLGASLALLGSMRRFDWIARRKECGSPCQLCAVRCRYGAIEPKGEVRYDECFQCMDCVVIHNDAKTCVPLVLADKKRAVVRNRVPAGTPVEEVVV
ncbi:MAG: 4Fe-4S binding protein [Alphaproteobacteria bacterium]|nr:4Fe-4S binding protein [Alphaproteobacteria bacterium]